MIFVGVFFVVGFDEVDVFMNSVSGMTKFSFISMGWTLVLGIVEYFIVCNLLKKKLNLA